MARLCDLIRGLISANPGADSSLASGQTALRGPEEASAHSGRGQSSASRPLALPNLTYTLVGSSTPSRRASLMVRRYERVSGR